MRAFLAMGSNIGDRRAQLRRAVAALPDLVAVSAVYETDPVGGPVQDDYYNIVVQLETDDRPDRLLARCQRLEADADRVRLVRWGPRTLDVDVLWIDGRTVETDDLTVPHPRMHQRNFVMVPLLTLDPTLEVPGYRPDGAVGRVRAVGPL